MAAIVETTKASCHVRSISFPSRSHPITQDVKVQLERLRSSSEATSSYKLNALKDLYEPLNDFLNLPETKRHGRSLEDMLEGSLRLLDVCGSTRDVFSQMKECIKELESGIRRKRGGESSVAAEVETYMISKKKLKQAVSKSLKTLKTAYKKKHPSTSLDTVSTLKQVEEVGTQVFESQLSSLYKSKSNTWSLVSKLMKSSKREDDEDSNEVEKMDIELFALKSCKNIKPVQVQNVLKGLEALESSIPEVEEELERVYRQLLRTRVTLLNILSQ